MSATGATARIAFGARWTPGHASRASRSVRHTAADASRSVGKTALSDVGRERASAIAERANMTVDEATAAMRELEAAVPGIDARMHVLRDDDLAELLNDLGSVRAGVAAIRRALPDADVCRIVLARTHWLFEDADLDSIAPRVADFREACPQLDVDRVVTDYPEILDIPSVSTIVAALAQRCQGECDVDKWEDAQRRVANEPNCLVSVSEAEAMIETHLDVTWELKVSRTRNGPSGYSETVIRWRDAER